MTMHNTIPYAPNKVHSAERRSAPLQPVGKVLSASFAALLLTAGVVGAAGVIFIGQLDGTLPRAFTETQKPGQRPIDPNETLTLVRTSLLRLDDAVRTQNFSIFRATASTAFQANNTGEDLAFIFAWLRDNNVSLADAAVLQSEHVEQPVLEQGRLLMVRGQLGGSGKPVKFDLHFESAPDGWRLFAIAVYKN